MDIRVTSSDTEGCRSGRVLWRRHERARNLRGSSIRNPQVKEFNLGGFREGFFTKISLAQETSNEAGSGFGTDRFVEAANAG
jgi:hypothetical protein